MEIEPIVDLWINYFNKQKVVIIPLISQQACRMSEWNYPAFSFLEYDIPTILKICLCSHSPGIL